MPAEETILLCVHGANQSDRTEESNHEAWSSAFRAEADNLQKLQPFLSGDSQKVEAYHAARNPQARYPAYRGWHSAWYGGVWASIGGEEFTGRLNPSSAEEVADQKGLLQRVERKVIQRHFDELVPFYELAVCQDGVTVYEKICDTVLENLKTATAGGKHYVVLAHSMGCAVSYNILTHLGRERAGEPYCEIPGALSDGYRDKIREFLTTGSRCFGLMTFGNYTGYNWCMRLNHKLLFGTPHNRFKYPDEVGRWRNFWTVLGGDPFILDDMLRNGLVDEDEDRFDDLAVWRPPGQGIGHGRTRWFRRDSFVKKLANQMGRHLYLA